jgi:biotin-dependent carboxylase-like uncharacterized protein
VSLTVLRTGPTVLVQDLGRTGHRAIGVGSGGAADRGSLRLGNRLLGNDEGAAGLEVVLGGLALQASADLLVTVTGAPAPATVDGRPVGHASVVRLRAGQELALGTPAAGLRTYVSVRGGLDTDVVLGARATDLLAGFGRPVQIGDVLPVGPPHGSLPGVEQAVTAPPPHLRVTAGPRADWVVGGLAALCERTWTVTAELDRVGVRLDGEPLRRARDGELASEGVLPGAVQVPPDGRPVLFLADAPVTGGYPVVAVLDAASLDLAAQLRPGDEVRLHVRRTETG